VLCDFDGTITSIGTLGFLFREFAASRFEYTRQWARGEIDMREEIRATFRTIEATKEEMEKALDKIEIFPGFIEFLDFIREKDYTFAIVSDGLDWYIKYILNRYDVQNIPVFANQIYFEEKGFRFDFPWFHEDTERNGVSKLKIVQFHKQHFNHVVFIGDGKNDVDAAYEADIVYSRGWLAGYCFAKDLGQDEFYDWYDLREKWIDL
jgi:2,3-diketo-5-methylthio-1-phosphopentane phosphatase